MTVAIIDDFIDCTKYNIGPLAYQIKICEDLSIEAVKCISTQKRGHGSHGTICAAIIRKYAPEIEIGSIQILNRDRRASLEQIVVALKWCEREQVTNIHMSIGSTWFGDFAAIRKVVSRLLKKGCIIVAACSNSGEYTLPAHFPGVVRVRADRALHGKSISRKLSVDGAIKASSTHLLENWDGSYYVTPFGNSFAAPLVTALIANDKIGVAEVQKIADIPWLPQCESPHNLLTQQNVRQKFFMIEKSPRFFTGSTELNCPLVVINESFSVALDTANLFAREGYYCCLFCEAQPKRLCNFIAKPNCCTWKQFLLWADLFYKPSLMIVCSGKVTNSLLQICDMDWRAKKFSTAPHLLLAIKEELSE